uniref:Serine protease 57 n=1 Tax=Otus sunia TaxID=257818 RepID=A0A8C8B6Q4_9STRI
MLGCSLAPTGGAGLLGTHSPERDRHRREPCPGPPAAGDHPHPPPPPGTQGSRIIGGKVVAPHSRPFIASIQVDGQHVCGGFLVWPKWVMTAGGHAPPRGSQQVFGIADSIAHPHYNPLAVDNDIRLLRLNRSATLNKYVKRIRLPSPHVDLKPGTVCYVMGWGDTSNYGDQPAELMETSTTIIKRSFCRTLWRGKVSPNMLCGASRNATLQGVCAGDSGGPLIFKDKVYGIVSFSGERCGDRRYPDIYTKISNYIDWVHCTVHGHRPQKGRIPLCCTRSPGPLLGLLQQ